MATTEDTSNDEMIARALAASQEEMVASAMPRPASGPSSTARSSSSASPSSPVVVQGTNVYPGNRQQTRSSRPIVDATIPTPIPSSQQPGPTGPPGFLFPPRQRVQMCHVPCVLEGSNGVCMEMMVDTGAETSVMSLALCRKLGLDSRIDSRERGIASGVGQAAIVGKIRGVICTLGHVEFPMDFAILDIRQSLLILGMDQLRHYNCIIDLFKDALIFGGPGGVEVPLLPPEQQPSFDPYLELRNACTIS